jgi:hypothetical protein
MKTSTRDFPQQRKKINTTFYDFIVIPVANSSSQCYKTLRHILCSVISLCVLAIENIDGMSQILAWKSA